MYECLYMIILFYYLRLKWDFSNKKECLTVKLLSVYNLLIFFTFKVLVVVVVVYCFVPTLYLYNFSNTVLRFVF